MSEAQAHKHTTPIWQVIAIWALVLVPMAWGVAETLMKASQLF